MKPSQNFLEVMRVARLCAKACGADVADENYKMNEITYVVIGSIVVYFMFTVYTVQLRFADGLLSLLESFCMVGTVLQGITKLLTGIIFTKQISSHCVSLTSIYVDYEVQGEGYIAALNECVSRVRTVLKIAVYIYVFVAVTLITVPIVILFLTGRRLHVMQFLLPRIDPDTTYGYFATIGVQSTCVSFGAFGNFAGDMIMMVMFAHIVLFVDIFKLKSEELNELAVEFDNSKVTAQLFDVVKWHQAYSSFAESCDCIFYWINFVQISTSGLSIVLTLCVMFTSDWPGSYQYLIYLFSMMYLYCGLGTMTEISNERIVEEIYAIHWYKLTIPQQKMVLFMLMKSQSPHKITVGGVAPLSVNTGLQVTKTVYSVFMMLLNFFS